jgi:hypothetical protein
VWTDSSLRDAQLHASGRQSAFPAPEVKPMVQAELLVDVQVETAKREEDGRLVQQLLYDYHCVPRKLIWFDDADRRIVNGAHDPIWVRAQLVAPPLFGGLEMRDGGAQYVERLLGALEPLPLFKPMFVVGKVIALRPPQLRELEISLKRLVTPEHTGAMRELSDQANGRPLRVKVQSDELGRRLALYWNRGTVRFKLRLNRSLRADARYEVVIEDAYLEGLSAEQHARLIEDCARELQRQAPSEKEWVELTVDGQDSAST